jgi:hypothetical protein
MLFREKVALPAPSDETASEAKESLNGGIG